MDVLECPPKETFSDLPEWLQRDIGKGIQQLQDVIRSRTREEAGVVDADPHAPVEEQPTFTDVASFFSQVLERFETSETFTGLDESPAYAELLLLYGRALLGAAWNALEQEAAAKVLGPPVPRYIATDAGSGADADTSDDEPERNEETTFDEVPDGVQEEPEDVTQTGQNSARIRSGTEPANHKAAAAEPEVCAAVAHEAGESTGAMPLSSAQTGKDKLDEFATDTREGHGLLGTPEHGRSPCERTVSKSLEKESLGRNGNGAAEILSKQDADAANSDHPDSSDVSDGDDEIVEGQVDDNNEDDEDDAQRAWEVLECSRMIFLKAGERYLPRVSLCYELLGDFSLYVNDAFEQAAEDYAQAIATAERAGDARSRRVASLAHRKYVALRSAGRWTDALDALLVAKAILTDQFEQVPQEEREDVAALVQELESECRMIRDAVRGLAKQEESAREHYPASSDNRNRQCLSAKTENITGPPPADAVPVMPRRGVKRVAADLKADPGHHDEKTGPSSAKLATGSASTDPTSPQ
jgi:hypothetical protein